MRSLLWDFQLSVWLSHFIADLYMYRAVICHSNINYYAALTPLDIVLLLLLHTIWLLACMQAM